LHAGLDNLPFITDTDHNSSQGGGFHRVKVASLETNQEFRGTIVFTGQPDKWVYPRPKELKKGAGKFYDFVFKNPSDNSVLHKLNDDDFENYQSIYKDSPDWIYWYDKLYTTGIPVFFMEEKRKSLKWGLALLFKLPYDHTPFETLPNSHKNEKYDLADCIFGSVDKDKSLKGRVTFGHAFCVSHNVSPMDEVRLILGSPKASYYPTYIAQDGNNGITAQYQTYNDGRISGWKRYVVKRTATGTYVTEGQNVSDRVYSSLTPLPENTKFSSTITFHNLKPEELGALISALTFHGHTNCQQEVFHHSQ
jgi:CRISPR-associated protein (TIGR03986 family)